MQVIRRVFEAMQRIGRPATRREIELESGLSEDAVWTGLRGLANPHRALLVRHGPVNGARGTYSLQPGARPPLDRRGHWHRDGAWLDRQRAAMVKHHASRKGGHPPAPMERSPSTPARTAVHGETAGGLRGEATTRCLLAELWRPHQRARFQGEG